MNCVAIISMTLMASAPALSQAPTTAPEELATPSEPPTPEEPATEELAKGEPATGECTDGQVPEEDSRTSSLAKDAGGAAANTGGAIAGGAVAGPIGAAVGGVVADHAGRAIGKLFGGSKRRGPPACVMAEAKN